MTGIILTLALILTGLIAASPTFIVALADWRNQKGKK